MTNLERVGQTSVCAGLQPALLLASLFLAACGYMGGPLAPLANIPQPIRDLAAIQRGDRIIAQFAIPKNTTENQPIPTPIELDLRIGPTVDPFNVDQWSARATHVPAPAKPQAFAHYEIPTTPFTGKEVVIAVRTLGGNGKASDWSNFLAMPVVPAPAMPTNVSAESMPNGVRLTWQAAGSHFHVLRQGPGEPQFSVIAPDLPQPEFLDTTAAIGTPYTYLVQTFVPLGDNKEAQSDLSAGFKYTRLAPLPGMPTGLLAVPSPNSIELSWDSNPDAQTVGYRVYRAVAGSDFAKIGDVGAIPTYSDRTVEHGKTYRYATAAVDKDGREGARSAPVEVVFP